MTTQPPARNYRTIATYLDSFKERAEDIMSPRCRAMVLARIKAREAEEACEQARLEAEEATRYARTGR